MDIIFGKSTLTTHLLSEDEEQELMTLFPFNIQRLDGGLKYLGFFLKPNDYRKQDWVWLLEKLKKWLKVWSHKWLSMAGRLVLVKAVLDVTGMDSKGILEAARRMCFRFLWSGKQEAQVTPWVRWERIAIPKGLGGWGLKNIFLFAKSLVATGGWRILKTENLWSHVMIQKYISPYSIEEWIQIPMKSHAGGSIFWKVVVKSFDVIEDSLAWMIRNGRKLRVGGDPWISCIKQHKLQDDSVLALRQIGIFYLNQLTAPVQLVRWEQS